MKILNLNKKFDYLIISTTTITLIYLIYYKQHNFINDKNNFIINYKNNEIKINKLNDKELDEKLRLKEFIQSVSRNKSIIKQIHFNQLNSNDPVEDNYSQLILQKNFNKHLNRNNDLYFFCLFDGHSGYHTSNLLSKTLIPSTTLHLTNLFNNIPPNTFNNKFNYIKHLLNSPFNSQQLDLNPQNVIQAIKNSFVALDNSLLQAPVKALSSLPKTISPPTTPDQSLLNVLSGSCALMAYFDESNQDLYVAVTGDSRAIAGYYDNGKWVVDVLTNDQTGKNPNEINRIKSLHPLPESPYVIQRGRILGGLEVSILNKYSLHFN